MVIQSETFQSDLFRNNFRFWIEILNTYKGCKCKKMCYFRLSNIDQPSYVYYFSVNLSANHNEYTSINQSEFVWFSHAK